METRQQIFEIDPTQRPDDDSRTVPVTLSSTEPCRRNDPYGKRYTEILSHDPQAIDLGREPLPLIEQHDSGSLNIGVVERISVAGDRLRGILRMGTQERANELWADIKAGIVRNLSIGIEVLKQTPIDEHGVTIITAWRPLEVSLVSIPMDPNAGIGRSKTLTENAPNTPPTPPADDNVVKMTPSQWEDTEINRREQVEQLFRMAGGGALASDPALDNLRQRCLFDPRFTLERAKDELLALSARPMHQAQPLSQEPPPSMAQRFAAPGLQHRSLVLPGGGGPRDDFFDAAGDALLLRAGYKLKDANPQAEGIRHMSCADIARTLFSRAGVSSAGMTPAQLFTRAYPDTPSLTSDFPLLLGDMLNKALRAGMETTNVTYRGWTNIRSVADYKTIRVASLGSAPNLPPVVEGADYTNYTPSEEAEEYAISKSGQIFQITREALVNDDISAFTQAPGQMISSALRYKSDIIYAVLSDNPAMSDTFTLFDSVNHANDVGVGALDPTQLGIAVALLRKQTATGGGYMNLTPRFLIVSPDDEQNARTLLSGYWNYQAGGATALALGVDGAAPLYPEMVIVVDPRVASPLYYVATSPGEALSVELAVLTGTSEGVSTETEMVFKNDTNSWKVRCEAGAAAADYRGIVRGGV